MKKIISLSLILVFALAASFALVGCGGENSGSSGSASNNIGLSEAVELTNVTITAQAIITYDEDQNDDDPLGLFTPDDDYVFVAVRFHIENTSSSTQVVSSMLDFSATVDGQDVTMSIPATISAPGEQMDETIEAGESFTGYFGLEVPEDARELVIVYNPDLIGTRDETRFIFTIPALG